jgi:TonB family protein
MALQYYRNGNYEKAAALYQQLFSQNESNDYYLMRFIDCLILMEDFEEAEKFLKRELRKNPTNRNIIVLYGQLLEEQSNEKVPEEEILKEKQVEFVDQSVEEETLINTLMIEKEPPPIPPPPSPLPPEPVVEERFKVVETMPRFPGCEDIGGTSQEKKACADVKMLEFIYKHLKYPAIARENGVDGTVVIQFVVEKDGSITNAKIVRDIGATCGAEALRVVNLMNQEGYQWIPGTQRGRPVKVQFNLPVKFKFE